MNNLSNAAQNINWLISNFVAQALRGEPVTLYGEGTQTRSFCYVDDLIDGLVRLMETGDDVTGPVNIGNPNEFSMVELAQLVIEKVDTAAGTVFAPLPSDDPRQRQPDIKRARTLLKWEPCVSLAEGLERTIEYFKQKLSPVPQKKGL